MVKFLHKSFKTLELSMVFSFCMLINFTCIFSRKRKQVSNLCVSLWYEVKVVSNTSFSFNFLVSTEVKTLVPQAFAGFCVYTNRVINLLIEINNFLLITLKPKYQCFQPM